jgi:hypothetical protein
MKPGLMQVSPSMILQHTMMVAKDALFFQNMFNMAQKSLWDRQVANSSIHTRVGTLIVATLL